MLVSAKVPYGLAAYGYSRSMQTVDQLGASIESGMVSINNSALALIETPFGGVKDSGYGSEGGAEAMSLGHQRESPRGKGPPVTG